MWLAGMAENPWQAIGDRILSRDLSDLPSIRGRLGNSHNISQRSGALFELMLYAFLSKFSNDVRIMSGTPDLRATINGIDIGVEAAFISGDIEYIAVQEGSEYLAEFQKTILSTQPYNARVQLESAPRELVDDPDGDIFPSNELLVCLRKAWIDLQYFDIAIRPRIPERDVSAAENNEFYFSLSEMERLLLTKMHYGRMKSMDCHFGIGEWMFHAEVMYPDTPRLFSIGGTGFRSIPIDSIREKVLKKKNQKDWAESDGINIVALSVRHDLVGADDFWDAFVRGSFSGTIKVGDPGPAVGQWNMKGAMGLDGGVPVRPDLAGFLGFYCPIKIKFAGRSVYLPTRYIYVPNPFREFMGYDDVNPFGDSLSRYDIRVTQISDGHGEIDPNPRYIEGMPLEDILS